MNTDSQGIKQDNFSLLRPTFTTPDGGILTVVGWKDKTARNIKKYVVMCSICSRDRELFGKGYFYSFKHSLINKVVPCGCSHGPKWTERQNKVRVSREAAGRGLRFLGWASEYKKGNTKLSLCCPEHGEWRSTTMNNFLRGCGCPECKMSAVIKDDKDHIFSFLSSGSFTGGTEFFRSERKNKKGHKVYWNYTCPKCSHDEYVKAGLCSGVFESFVGDLKVGRLSCRCTNRCRWSREQREYQIKSEISRRKMKGSANYKFIGWDTEYKNQRSKFKYLCNDHGEQIISVIHFLKSKSGCPQCANKNQMQAYINLVTGGNIPIALKFGIANSSGERIKYQNCVNTLQMKNINVWVFNSVKECKEAENECKNSLRCGVLSPRELKDGWTETTEVYDLDKIIRIYEKNGGVKL